MTNAAGFEMLPRVGLVLIWRAHENGQQYASCIEARLDNQLPRDFCNLLLQARESLSRALKTN